MKAIKFLVLFILSTMLFGCASLDYTGEDYKTENSQTIRTQEDFVFNTYKKSLGDVNVKIGITKSPIQEILVMYVQIENLNYENPYTFKVEDLRVHDELGDIQFITSNNYLNIYQTQESSAMSAMSNMGATFSNMTGLTSTYSEVNQAVVQNASGQASKDVYSKMETIGNSILKHSIRTSSSISPRRGQYFYFFFQDREKSPINVRYKTLNYQFKL